MKSQKLKDKLKLHFPFTPTKKQDELFTDLAEFAPGKQLTLEVVHADGSVDNVKLNHTYNAQQIDWFKAGSALNLIKTQNNA